jgi:hypothetical protein
MDRGMVSEKNLEFMRKTGARYLVGTPKAMLKKIEKPLLEQNWEQVQPGVDVKLCRSPEDTDDTFVLCRSQGRKEKENAILGRFVSRLETKLNDLAHQAQIGKARDKQKAERRIGRLLERNSRPPRCSTLPLRRAEEVKTYGSVYRSRKMKSATNGQWRPAAATSCGQTGPKVTRKPSGIPTSSLRKWKTLSVPKKTTWGCGRSSTANRSGPRRTSSSVSLR